MFKRIADIIGWIGVAVVFVALAVTLTHPAWQRYAYWMAIAGLGCIVLYAAAHWREIVQAFSGRQARLGTLTAVGTLIVLGILVAVNYLGAREDKRWDLTAAHQNTLSEQTQKVLSKLDAPLTMIVFARQTDFERYRQSLREYPYASKKVSIEYVDPDRNPDRAKQYQIQTYGTIALAYKGRTERVVSDAEQDVANGIIKIVTGEQKKIYFVQGHDERDTAATDQAGYSSIAAAVARDNYSVDKLNLAQHPDVPADASVVVVAGPKVDFMAPETDALRRYLAKGGKLLMMLDPPEKADSAPLTNLIALAHEWGISVDNDIVVDTSGMGQFFGTGPLVPLAAPPYPPFPITDRFRLNTAFPLTRSITPATGGVNGHNAQPFVQTSADSWATDAVRALKTNKIELKQDTDKQGPITVAAAVSAPVDQKAAVEPANQKPDGDKPKPETRVAVIGDSDFVANNYIGITRGNPNLFTNTVNWLAQQENLISVRPREAEDRRVSMTSAQQRNLAWLSLFIIPAAVFGIGVYTWWRRR